MAQTQVLIDALNYIKRFKQRVFVVKIGGEVVLDGNILDAISEDLILLKFLGIHPVLVHGGGVEITREMEKQGKKPKFVQGLRVTDKETMAIVQKVFSRINSRVRNAIGKKGGKAAEFPAKTEILFLSEKQKSKVDIGFVGEIKKISALAIKTKINQGCIPVVSSIGQSKENVALNINADTAAAELAAALHASKIIFLTNVQGVLDQNKNLIKTLTIQEAEKLIKSQTASGGMIPKLKACNKALNKKVQSAHIIQAGGHALLEEILTKEGTGT
ncbi:MAG: acetylglutamate kinase, partial [Candidatus Altiarchaeales archaeon]|nr:acetylglutamate kinase [Candidatus Altiarchaeales archaeon]